MSLSNFLMPYSEQTAESKLWVRVCVQSIHSQCPHPLSHTVSFYGKMLSKEGLCFC